MILELLNTNPMKNKISKRSQSNDQWHLKPFETKSIVRLNYIAYKMGLLNAFICIKTNSNDTILIPVEINVSNRSGLYSYSHLLSFTPDRILRSISTPIQVPVYVINNRQDPLIISVCFEIKRKFSTNVFVNFRTFVWPTQRKLFFKFNRKNFVSHLIFIESIKLLI